jgi:MFS family permease
MLPDSTKDVAGVLLIILRIVQGLALGGEYGGAATYIAEHAPPERRGFYTSFIQITATAGLVLSLAVISIVSTVTGPEAFKSWGWRIPFLLSVLLVGVSVYIRLSLKESPMFLQLQKEGKKAKNPLKESFSTWYNIKFVALSLFGATMGQGVVWYTSQFYSLFYLQTVFKLPILDSNLVVGIALLLATPFFVLVGHLSDKYGRKPFMLLGMALGVATYYPIYYAMEQFRYSTISTVEKLPVVMVHSGYSPTMLCFLVWIQTLFVTLVYGPIAAFLVELFPTSIRYTSLSVPYHIGNGVFGGLVPIVGLILIKQTGNIYSGLWYPMTIAGICFVINLFFVSETNKNSIVDNVQEARMQELPSPLIIKMLESAGMKKHPKTK